LAVVAANKLEESVSWGKKANHEEKRSETQPRNCVLALFSANRVSAFIALRRAIARHKRVFVEGSGCFPFSGGTKSATRTSPASPRRTERRREKERWTDRNSFRIETQYRVSYKSTPEKYSSAEVYDHPKVCLCIFQRSRHVLSLFFSILKRK